MNLNESFKRYNFLDPVKITLALWLFVICGNFVFQFYLLEIKFLMVLLLAIGFFIAGMLLYRTWIKTLLAAPSNTIVINTAKEEALINGTVNPSGLRITQLLILFQIIGLVFFVKAYTSEIDFSDPIAFLQMRNIYLEEVRGERGKLFMYTTHLTLFGIAFMYVMCKRYFEVIPRKKASYKRLFMLVTFITFCSSLLTTSRTTPLLVLIFFIFYCYRFYIYKRSTILRVFFSFFLIIFFSIALILGKEGLSTEGGISDNIIGITGLIKIYFFSSPKAMEYIFYNTGGFDDYFCSNIFKYFIDLISKFSTSCKCEPRELEFVFIPEPTNVFTFFRAYWQDFGWFFPFAILLTGMLNELVFQKAITTFSIFTYIYPFFLNSLLLQIFEEQIFANISVLVYLLFFYVFIMSIYYRKAVMKYIFGFIR